MDKKLVSKVIAESVGYMINGVTVLTSFTAYIGLNKIIFGGKGGAISNLVLLGVSDYWVRKGASVLLDKAVEAGNAYIDKLMEEQEKKNDDHEDENPEKIVNLAPEA